MGSAGNPAAFWVPGREGGITVAVSISPELMFPSPAIGVLLIYYCLSLSPSSEIKAFTTFLTAVCVRERFTLCFPFLKWSVIFQWLPTWGLS